jgi:uncharacterized protein YceH (UPF0502 family)
LNAITELDALSRRVLGALLEKEQTTPDNYPLTLNALISACNQTTNRNPVMNLKQYEVLRGLHNLERFNLVERVTGARADRWSHLLLDSDFAAPPRKALLTVLLLRSSQTVGELKARTERMYRFDSLSETEETLRTLGQLEPPLVVELPRQPGQKESRWRLNVADVDETETEAITEAEEFEPTGDSTLLARVEELERKVAEIQQFLDRIKSTPEE